MSLKRYEHLASFVLAHPWAIERDWLRFVAGILGDRLAGKTPDPAAIEAALTARKPIPQPRRGSLAVIALHGVLAPRANMLTNASGGTSYEGAGAALADAVNNPEISTIVLDVDSPGGSVAGATEFAAQVREARAVKPIVAVAHFAMHSAAYWIASNATKVYASPSASVGSIGVFSMHDDLSEALAKQGIKRTFIGAGKYKLEQAEAGPLSDEAIAYQKETVHAHYARFVDDVAKGRNVKASAVRSGFGEGRTVLAAPAVDLGMIDGIQTFEETIARLLPAGTSALSVTADTSQDPRLLAVDTDQDRAADASWRAQIDRDLLALTLP